MTRNEGCSQTLHASASIWSNYGMWVTPSPQEAIWLFSSTFLPEQTKEMPAWATPAAHRAQQRAGHTRGPAAAADVPSEWAGQAAGEAHSLHSQGIENVLPGASRKVQPLKSSPRCRSHPLATVLLFQRGNSQLLSHLVYPSTEMGTGIWTIAR